MRVLDLFCCAGGASYGLRLGGATEIVGVDMEPRSSYPFTFIQADALTFPLDGFDFVWASPPCQGWTAYKRRKNHVRPRPNLIPATRKRLIASGIPFVIENVGGAPLRNPIMLCGSMFGLDVQRHRFFETSFPVIAPQCDHSRWTPRFAPATNRKNLRKTVEIGVWRIPLEVQHKAMGGCEWMSREELSQAIPPAYSRFLLEAFLSARHSWRGQ